MWYKILRNVYPPHASFRIWFCSLGPSLSCSTITQGKSFSADDPRMKESTQMYTKEKTWFAGSRAHIGHKPYTTTSPSTYWPRREG